MNRQCHRHTVYQFINCMYICTLHTHTKYNFCLSPKNPCHRFGDIQPHWECIIYYKHHFHTMGEKTEPWRDWLTCSRPHTRKRQTPGPSLISLQLQFKLSAHPFPRNDKWEEKGQLSPHPVPSGLSLIPPGRQRYQVRAHWETTSTFRTWHTVGPQYILALFPTCAIK